MGLSTREATSKGPRSQAQGMQAMQQSRPGKHFHRTSFLIQAFNHKFRLILELNPTLIAPNILQRHVFNENTDQQERPDYEMCYYHGIVEGLEWSAAAVRTCNGLSGIIHMGNETFIIHPFYGGDLSHKHPHIVFEAKSVGRQSCGNKYLFEKYNNNYNVHQTPFGSSYHEFGGRRVEEKNGPQYFIELAVLLDKPMFDKRNGSTRLQVIHDALQIVNIADLYFRKLSTAISVVYVETWQKDNFLALPHNDRENLQQTLAKLTDIYGPRSLYKINKDSTMLISGVAFQESGVGVPSSICKSTSMGVVTDVSIYQPHITGVALAHMLGHNLNMPHDQEVEGCHCPNWYGCIMSENIVGRDGIQPYRFSECSRRSYLSAFSAGHAICLSNKPNMFEPPIKMTCGNGQLEPGEECDCGTPDQCAKDPCCDGLRCRLYTTSQCANEMPCCENCQFKRSSIVCRPAASECDLPEYCTGVSAECPLNTYKKNGSPCGDKWGYCYNGFCPTLDQQCKAIWDWGAKVANKVCFDHFNVRGLHNGHCGREKGRKEEKGYRSCSEENVMCGLLHCKGGEQSPTAASTLQNTTFSRSLFKINGTEVECKSLNGQPKDLNADQMELVRDGTKCDTGKICLNQTCIKVGSLLDGKSCPTNHDNLPCSGHGDCSNVNICHCFDGYEGLDCSMSVSIEHLPGPEARTTPVPLYGNETTTTKQGKIIVAGPDVQGSNTIVLVFGMVSVVGGVFLLFAMLALCYRRSTVPKYETSHPSFNPKTFKLTHNPPPVINPQNIDNRILSFTQLPTFRDQHNLGVTGSVKNLGASGGVNGDDETGDETSAFLGTPNSVGGNRFPEKGILKKFVEEDGSQSDNNEGLCEVERTLKSLNGYHEDILAALRVAAAQRGVGDVNSTPPPQDMYILGISRLSDGYPEYPDFGSEFPLLRSSTDRIAQGQQDEESNDETGGPLRIRNLEDLLRQLEHHSSGRHMSPCGSEDIRMSETEADRHYRLHSADCGGDDDNGFVLGRYRGPGMTSTTPVSQNVPKNMSNHNNNNNFVRSRTPMSDYGHMTVPQPDNSQDDLDSCLDGYASPFCPCYFCNQPNLLNTSTSEEEEDDEDEETARQMSRSRSSVSSASRKLQNMYNPPSVDSFGSQSPPMHLSSPLNGILPNYKL
ncbi:unnamed protein product [Allacma fusca]|uniref:Disintegrin and metalloproteinase domain-containing protein 11 n=1 Tax=Allacma fusca TaxID=39272 RepID=A0A8J2P996_9HEXA|nr:unnamed protein product [Allacma fusca]